jgi:hypothetical protein
VTLEADLGHEIGERHVLVDPSVAASYETDWTRRFSGSARSNASRKRVLPQRHTTRGAEPMRRTYPLSSSTSGQGEIHDDM